MVPFVELKSGYEASHLVGGSILQNKKAGADSGFPARASYTWGFPLISLRLPSFLQFPGYASVLQIQTHAHATHTQAIQWLLFYNLTFIICVV